MTQVNRDLPETPIGIRIRSKTKKVQELALGFWGVSVGDVFRPESICLCFFTSIFFRTHDVGYSNLSILDSQVVSVCCTRSRLIFVYTHILQYTLKMK